MLIVYWIVHLITSMISFKAYHENFEWSSDSRDSLKALSIIFGPIMFLFTLVFYPSYYFGWIKNPFKKYKKPLPWTHHGYLWWEVVRVKDDFYIVVWSWNLYKWWYLELVLVNSTNTYTATLDEVTSIQSKSEFAEELRLLDESNKFMEEWKKFMAKWQEIQEQAMKLRKNLLTNIK